MTTSKSGAHTLFNMAGPDPAELDAQDAFTGFRNDFWIPSKTELNDAHILSRQDGEKVSIRRPSAPGAIFMLVLR